MVLSLPNIRSLKPVENPIRHAPNGMFAYSDATMILCRGEPSGGTALTIKYCEQLNKPYMVYQLKAGEALYVGSLEYPQEIAYWLNTQNIEVLNVAGPREGKHCLIYDYAYAFLRELFQLMQKPIGKDPYLYESFKGDASEWR